MVFYDWFSYKNFKFAKIYPKLIYKDPNTIYYLAK